MMTQKYLSTADVAAILNVPRQSVNRLCLTGKLPAVNVSTGRTKSRYRIAPSSLDAFLQGATRKPLPSPKSITSLPPVKQRV